MSTYHLPSGLLVTDARHTRGLPFPKGDDGREDTTPNSTPPGDDVHTVPGDPASPYEPISVGPNASAGQGNTNVMYPGGLPAHLTPSAWSGWPVDWTPPWSSSDFLGQYGRLVDIVFAAIDLNASILSTMPPYIVKGAVPQDEEPWLVNPEPEVYPSWTAFAKEVFWCLQSCGEVFLYVTARYADTDGGYPRRFMMLNPTIVGLDRVDGAIEYRIGGMPVDADDILHIKYASWPGDLHGHGPLEVAGARILAASALTKYATGVANSGGIPPAVLRHPKRLTRNQMAQMQSDYVTARMSGMGLPAVLSDGTELDVLSNQMKDQAVSELQKFSEARIATLLGVPPTLLGLPSGDSATYTNSTNLFDFHWRASLRPKAEQVMSAMSGWLLPRKWGVELNRDEYIRPGLMERSQSYSMLIAAGVITPQEVRVMERWEGKPYVPPEALSGAPGVAESGIDPSSTVNAPGDAPWPTAPTSPAYGSPGRPTVTNTSPAGS